MSYKFHKLYGDRRDSAGARFITGGYSAMDEIEALAEAVHGPHGIVATSLEAKGFITPETDCDCDSCMALRAEREALRTGVTAGEETGDSDGNAPRYSIAVRRTPATMAAGLKLRTERGVHWHDVWQNAMSAARSTLTRKAKPVHGRKWTPDDIDACASDIYGNVWEAERAGGHVTGETAERGTADARFTRPARVTVGRMMGDASNWARDLSTEIVNGRKALAEVASLAGETAEGPEQRDRPDREMRAELPTNPIVRKLVLMDDATETASAMLMALGAPNDRPHRATAYVAAREAHGASIGTIAAELQADPATLRQWRSRVGKRLPSVVNAPAVTVTVTAGESRWHPAQYPHAEALHVAHGGVALKATRTRSASAEANDTGGYWRGAGAPMPEAATCTARKLASSARKDGRKDNRPVWARDMAATHRDTDGNARPMPGARLHTARRLEALSKARKLRRAERSATDRKALALAAGVTR